MPNGHTGGFEIDTAELKRLIMSTPEADASLFTGGSPVTPVTATEVGGLLAQCQQDRVYVEEQDHTHYIIHISDEPVVWIMVGPNSALHPPLLARHTQQVNAIHKMLAAKTPSVLQPGRLEATSRSAVLVIAMLAAAVFVLLGWLLLWLGVFGRHLFAR
jgi:hypothetical protein